MSVSDGVETVSNQRSYKDVVAGSHTKSDYNPSKRPRFLDSRYYFKKSGILLDLNISR